MRARRTFLCWMLTARLALNAGGIASAHAAEIAGPIRAAPPAHRLWRAQRLEIAATPGGRLAAGSEPALLWGAQVRYYLWDRVGVSAWGTGTTALGDACAPSCALLAAPELVAVPIAGKLPFLDYRHSHVHVTLAPAWVWPASEPTASFGGGLEIFSAPWFSTALDYRAVTTSPVSHFVTVSLGIWLGERRWSDE